jgi:heme exporter protein B
MRKIVTLIKNEFVIQNKTNNLGIYLFGFFLFCTFSVSMINNHNDIQKYGMIFSIIAIPLGLLAFANVVFKNDLDDGHLEFLLINFDAHKIVIAKIICIFTISICSAIANIPFIWIIFSIEWKTLLYLSVALILLIASATSTMVLIGAVQSYFRENTNFLSVFVMPLIIPNIILSGLILKELDLHLIYIMLGINLVLLPISISLSGYLIKNIYNL